MMAEVMLEAMLEVVEVVGGSKVDGRKWMEVMAEVMVEVMAEVRAEVAAPAGLVVKTAATGY